MSRLDLILSGLQKVRKSAPGEWTACCPAHEDRSPSLAIKDAGDGRLLIHCFSGCSAEEVVSALGLTLADLMPEKAPPEKGLKRLPFNPRTVLEVLAFRATFVAVAASDMAQGRALTEEDRKLLNETVGFIHEAVGYVAR